MGNLNEAQPKSDRIHSDLPEFTRIYFVVFFKPHLQTTPANHNPGKHPAATQRLLLGGHRHVLEQKTDPKPLISSYRLQTTNPDQATSLRH